MGVYTPALLKNNFNLGHKANTGYTLAVRRSEPHNRAICHHNTIPTEIKRILCVGEEIHFCISVAHGHTALYLTQEAALQFQFQCSETTVRTQQTRGIA
jgi:hypothetical protein